MILFYTLAGFIALVVTIIFGTNFAKPKEYSFHTTEYVRRLPKTAKEWSEFIFGGLIIGGFAGAVLSAIMIMTVFNLLSLIAYGDIAKNKGDGVSYSLEITAFEDNHTYIVSRRNVDESDKYHFMRTWGDGFKSGWVYQDESVIYFADSNYRVDVHQNQYEYNQKWLPKQIIDFAGKEWFIDSEKEYAIYVPKEAIKENSYNIDLK